LKTLRVTNQEKQIMVSLKGILGQEEYNLLYFFLRCGLDLSHEGCLEYQAVSKFKQLMESIE
jgi:hypothetical protein